MHPVLFKVPVVGWDIAGYGLMLMIGMLLSIWWAARRAIRSGANPDVVLNCGFIAIVAGVLGARLMYVAHYWKEQFAHQPNTLLAVLDVRQGGLEVYGGVIAVAVCVLFYLIFWKHSIRWYLDIMAPSAALGMGIGRIGCFLNGCCWGGVCDLPWAIEFPYSSPAYQQQWTDHRAGTELPQQLLYVPEKGLARPITRELLYATVTDADIARAQANEDNARAQVRSLQARYATAPTPEKERIGGELKRAELVLAAAAEPYKDIRAQMKKYDMTAEELRALARHEHSLPVHPAQLYSTITLLLLAALLSTIYWRRTRDGQVICTFLLIEPLTRWLLETVRADNPVDSLGVFTISQALALGLSALGLIGLLALRRLPPRSPRARLWEPPPEEKTKGGKAQPAT